MAAAPHGQEMRPHPRRTPFASESSLAMWSILPVSPRLSGSGGGWLGSTLKADHGASPTSPRCTRFGAASSRSLRTVSYTHLRAHETSAHL
eukprot:3088231-Alexandrium_andersonii.AAC.1